MADPKQDGAPPREVHVEDKKSTNWLAWLALAAGLLALLWYLTRDRDDDVAVVDNTVIAENMMDDGTASLGTDPIGNTAMAVGNGVSGLGGYLAGTEALPRTFTFERVNFATGSSAMRPQDLAEITSIASSLQQYPNARMRVVGYADARGDAATNATLGKARADSMKAALVEAGVAGNRIETASGGESDATATNATTEGQAENRRAELVVLQR